MSNNVTGTIAVTLEDVSMGHGASPTSLFRTAQDFLEAAEMLDPTKTAAPFGFVAAQCLELALKTYLMKNAGMTERQLKEKVGHDIGKAWSRCVAAGLGLATLPTWAAHLDAGHDSPYLFRYAQDNTGIVLAPKAQVVNGLKEVLAVVQAATGVT